MGNTAIVAFRNTDGTHDLHRSPDGATNYQLLVPLALAATSDDTRYRDFVAALDAPEAAVSTPGGRDYEFLKRRSERNDVVPGDADPSTLLEADPYETDIQASNLMSHLTPETEHLYVVDDDLNLYYPAWGSIGLLSWFQQSVRIEAYDRNRVQNAGQVEALVNLSPDHTYEGDDFAKFPLDAEATSDWYQVFSEHFQTLGANAIRDAFEYDSNDQSLERVRVLNPEWVFVIEPLDDAIEPPESVSRALYPVHIPLDSKNSLDEIDDDFRTVRAEVAKTALYIDGMMLATEMPVEQDAIRARGGEMFLENLQESYGNRLATQFLSIS